MLDPKGRESIIGIIRKLRDTHKVTVILITHHMDETIEADRLIVMSDGSVLMDGKPREIFKKVEELRATGLDVPETVSLLYELNHCGFDLKLDALSVEECALEIYSALK
jgi:energy-coupling factor transport system ATP-binding protein